MTSGVTPQTTIDLLRNPDLLDMLCERIESGGSLRAFAREHGVALSTIQRWIEADDNRKSHYARARESRAEFFAEEINTLADRTIEGDIDPNAARVAIDAKKWAASKLLPKVYGDRQQVDLNVSGDLPGALDAARARIKASEGK